MEMLENLCIAAKTASYTLKTAGTELKNKALEAIASNLLANSDRILAENEKDIKKAHESGMNKGLIDRLTLTSQRIEGIAEGVRQVASLPDPVGEVLSMTQMPNGLKIGRKRVPLGVAGVIYESRPNVTVDTAVLCLKSSNAVILRGGSDAFCSNKILSDIMREALENKISHK